MYKRQIPLSAVASGIVDFAISFVILLGLMLYYGFLPGWTILWVPFLVLFTLLAAAGVGLWLSALNVQYRDIQHMIPFLVQIWLFISPVAYSAEMLHKGLWRVVYGLNPLAGVIQGFRWALLGAAPPDELMIASIAMVMVLLVSGLFYFRRMEKTFADVV